MLLHPLPHLPGFSGHFVAFRVSDVSRCNTCGLGPATGPTHETLSVRVVVTHRVSIFLISGFSFLDLCGVPTVSPSVTLKAAFWL